MLAAATSQILSKMGLSKKTDNFSQLVLLSKKKLTSSCLKTNAPRVASRQIITQLRMVKWYSKRWWLYKNQPTPMYAVSPAQALMILSANPV